MKRLGFALLALTFVGLIGCGGGDEGGGRPPRAAAKSGGAKSDGGNASEGGGAAAAEPTGWGTLTGTIQFSGDVPEAAPLSITKDVEVCGPFNLRDESLVVNPENKGIANVFVYLRTKVKHHESYDAKQEDTVVFSNENCRFSPHAVAIWLPQTMEIKNDDPVAHNTNINALGDSKGSTNQTLTPGATQVTQFGRKQNAPIPATCSIHPWMNGFILPTDTPYFAVTDENGQFTIENVPAGIELEFQVWHEKAGNLAAKSDWKNGRMKVTLEPDQNTDLGEVQAVSALFNK